jgi:hypothetical protein
MTPEGSGHLQPAASLLQSTTHLQPTANQLQQSITAGPFHPVACHIQPVSAAGHLQTAGSQFQPVAAAHIQPTVTQYPFIQTAPLSSGGSTYYYQLVGPTQSLIAGQQVGTTTGAATTAQFSLIGFQPVFPFGTAAAGPTAGTLIGGGQIKTEHGAQLQVAFNTATNQMQTFPLQQPHHQLLSLHPSQLQQQLQYQPVPVSSQQLLCSPQFLASGHQRQAPAAMASAVKKKKARQASRKKAGPSGQPSVLGESGGGETTMQEQQLVRSDHLRDNLDIIIVVETGPCSVLSPAQHASEAAVCNTGDVLSVSYMWQALNAAGLLGGRAESSSLLCLNAVDGHQLIESGIGLISVDAADSGGQKLIAVAAVTALRDKLVCYKPKIVVFHGKTLYEAIFAAAAPPLNSSPAGDKKVQNIVTFYGRQPGRLFEMTEAAVPWVMPSSADRCCGGLVTRDKLLPCYRALRRLRDHISGGGGPRPTETELTFSLTSLAVRARKVRKEEFILRQEDNSKSSNNREPRSRCREETPSTSVQSLQQVRFVLRY